LKLSKSDPGVVVSAAAHVALLVVSLVAFSDTNKYHDAQETVPVEIITDQQLNQIMKGEKDAKQAQPTPVKADKVAELEDKTPTQAPEAKVDVPTPPPPLKRIPDPGEDDAPSPPTPPRRAAVPPPEPPTPPTPPVRPADPPKAEPAPEPPKRDAEAIKPVQPPKPTPPTPPTRPRQEAKKPDDKPVPDKPAPDKPTPDKFDKTALAKLLDQKKPDDPKPASRPKSGDETNDTPSKFDSNAIARLLSHDTPGQRPSTARAVSQQASLGSPTANAPKMSPSMWGQLDGLMQDRYKQCWSYIGTSTQRYIPQIKVEFTREGALSIQPVLLNPPSDPNLRSLAESALRAVRNPHCNPMPIPAQFQPYFEQWKGRILRFDPEEMAG
jgi:colicin import membrane protein